MAQGHSEGAHPFPEAWRKDSSRVLMIPALTGIQPAATNPLAAEDAAHYLVKLLSGQQRYAILETGPLTNLADALKLNPAIKGNIRRIYVMGGAVRVAGNVDQAGYDGSAEWNFFNQPQAAAFVLRSGIPITLVPLDATNKVPLTQRFLDQLSAQSSVASQLAAQAWRLAAVQPGTNQYYFWDTLTAAVMLDRNVVTMKNLKLRVLTNGASQGRTQEHANGNLVEVALDAYPERVERMFLDVLGR
jgi:purine nucleosidase